MTADTSSILKKAGVNPLSIFPTYDSLEDVHNLAISNLPVTSKNRMTALLGCYHNTLLKVVSHGS